MPNLLRYSMPDSSLHPPRVPGQSRGRHRHDGPGLATERSELACRVRCETVRRANSKSLASHGAINPLHFVPKAKRVIWLYQAGRADAPGDLRLQAAACQAQRPADARIVHQGPADRAASRGQAHLLRAAVRLPAVRQVGAADLRALSAHRLDRRRNLHRPLDADGGHQPRSGPHLHEHRHHDLRPPGRRLVDHLRPGQREPRPARLRRLDLHRPRRADAADLLAAVAQRLLAQPLSRA